MQGFPLQAPQLLPSQSRQAPSRSRSAQAAAMLRNTTALRASAREFVPGGFKAAPPAPQPGEPFISVLAALPLTHPAAADAVEQMLECDDNGSGWCHRFSGAVGQVWSEACCRDALSLHIAL